MKRDICIWLRATRHKYGLGKFWINSSTGIYDPKAGVWRAMNSPFQLKGTADILGYFQGGRFLAIEVKTDEIKDLFGKISQGKSYPTKEQKQFIDEANAAGCIALIARSWQDVEKRFDEEVRVGRLACDSGDTVPDPGAIAHRSGFPKK